MMKIWEFILLVILWIPIEYLCIHFEVKKNPGLFYSLNKKTIIKILDKLEKGRKNDN